MSDPFYIAKSDIGRLSGVHRRAVLEDGTQLDFGVHGAVKAHYGLHDEADLPLAVDYVAAAAGG
jgi:hypothetical protein